MRQIQILKLGGPKNQYSNEGEPDNSNEDSVKVEDNAGIDGLKEACLHLVLDESDMENEGELESIDGTSIYIDVHAHQALLEDDNI